MVCQFLSRIKGKFLSFCKYNKQRFQKTPRFLLTQRVKAFLKQGKDLNIPEEEAQRLIKYLHWNLVGAFNGSFVHLYDFRNYHIQKDKAKGLWFIYTSDGKRLYCKRGMSRKDALYMYRSLEKEQDPLSPHCYFFEKLNLSENSVVADIGVAEGNFGLKIVDRIKELYLFECDKAWIEALEATFEPWKEKVHIVNRYVSNTTSSDTVRLDDFFRDKHVPSLLKLDVEGAENAVLDGCAEFLKKGLISDLLVCTYHKKGDPENLSAKLKKFNYSVAFSQGYMLFLPNGYDYLPPYDFRRGLLHASIPA